jgi:TM2 domain-containing membrane protein YozV
MNSTKIIALVVNCFFPGIGTLMAGKKTAGIIQLILTGVAILMIITLIGALLGVPLALGAWIWSIISVATMNDSEFEKK